MSGEQELREEEPEQAGLVPGAGVTESGRTLPGVSRGAA